MKYTVYTREVHKQAVEIEAKNPREAIEKVSAGEGKETTREFLYTEDTDIWTVEDEDYNDVTPA